ncbi:MAG: hypothetical protein JNL96_18460 [Planctomycetaceae bacterium]|nr:hypothetical protein [Planctomycetaceae bacterium]
MNQGAVLAIGTCIVFLFFLPTALGYLVGSLTHVVLHRFRYAQAYPGFRFVLLTASFFLSAALVVWSVEAVLAVINPPVGPQRGGRLEGLRSLIAVPMKISAAAMGASVWLAAIFTKPERRQPPKPPVVFPPGPSR